ncbi:MAG TPA: FAD-dependent monooxygenase [Chitinophagaceae bacterium]|nr:FAD-dependent monooxygenase [Chitinophagaceae bacterium]
MQTETNFDIAFVGAGLAGLAGAIQCAKKGFKVLLIEKEAFPFHKVCGEYISMESFDFLSSLGVPLSGLHLPLIKTLQISAPDGKRFTTRLPLGGFGISRYKLDALLADIAAQNNVVLLEKTKVEAIKHSGDGNHSIQLATAAGERTEVKTRVCCCSYGKRSNLDVRWHRSFLDKKHPSINNYVAVKYHIETDWPEDLIGLHNFKNGYCGISRIEEGKYCLCYLTRAENLKANGNSIAQMEKEVLFKNPVLKGIFEKSTILYEAPLTISQISFSRKTLVEDGALMLGDAAGMITPLCGNGMSMALHSSKIASHHIERYLQHKTGRAEMEAGYTKEWEETFKSRLATGRILQGFFGSPLLSNLFVRSFKLMPFMAENIIRRTHGKPF